MTIFLYYICGNINKKLSVFVIIGSSLFFYGWFNWKYLLVFICSIIVNYLFSIIIYRSSCCKRLFLGVIIGCNLSLLFYFKYYNFFISNINSIFKTDISTIQIMLPLGISFYIFQQISYQIDSYRDHSKSSISEYIAYITFFPQLVAGPIVFSEEFIPQIRDDSIYRLDFDNLAQGMFVFCLGLFKKMEIADTCGRVVDWGFNNIDLMSSLEAWITIICYTFQIYFDFSGYSDMAIGMARMLNITLPQNFNSPYKALSIRDFWNRWHITLTRFLRKYIYIPLGGNRFGNIRTSVNIMIVYLVSGIWHGAAWTFILWGGIHGMLCVLERYFSKQSVIYRGLKWMYTFSMVSILWLLFRADSVKQWITILKKLVVFDLSLSIHLNDTFFMVADYTASIIGGITSSEIWIITMIPFLIVLLLVCVKGKNLSEIQISYNIGTAVMISLIILLCIFSLSRNSYYIYFNF